MSTYVCSVWLSLKACSYSTLKKLVDPFLRAPATALPGAEKGVGSKALPVPQAKQGRDVQAA